MSKERVALIACTTAFEGIRAGAGTFRMLVDLPARSRLGIVAFAEFSRATDLSTAGFIFWALYGIGGAVLTGATWWVLRRSTAPASVRRLSLLAALCSLLILILTTQAAPLMLRVGSSPNDEALLSHLLEPFVSWTILRILCADVSFCAMLTALTLLALGAQKTTAPS
jgi:hypothetical protein